jgi:KDO2-lipid IV(A) lauroyltransferase
VRHLRGRPEPRADGTDPVGAPLNPVAAREPTAADRREGGTWSPAQEAKNALLYALVSATIAVLSLLPPPLLRAIGGAVGAVAYLAFRDARRTAHANVARALADMPASSRVALVRACFRRLGRHLGDTVALLGGSRFAPLDLEPSAVAVLKAARSEGRGVVFASAHLGPWERVAGSLVAAGFPLTTVARQAYDPRLTGLYNALRGALGVRVVYRGAPGAPSRLLRTLKEGRLLGMPMDLRSRVPSIEAPFLGHPAATAVGPARIALRTGAPVVVGTVAPGLAGLVISATRIDTHDLASTAEGELLLTRRMNEELSRRIVAVPEEWVWMHPRWPDGID